MHHDVKYSHSCHPQYLKLSTHQHQAHSLVHLRPPIISNNRHMCICISYLLTGSMNDMYITTHMYHDMKCTHNCHPLPLSTLPGTLEAFCYSSQQGPVHIHSLHTAVFNKKHILTSHQQYNEIDCIIMYSIME